MENGEWRMETSSIITVIFLFVNYFIDNYIYTIIATLCNVI